MQGAGGVGGLLTQVDIGAVKSYAYLYDGNGNVGQLIDNSDGSIDAHYEYDPYGNSILASGAAASGNPYRFSTKYLDSEYDLYYYGYRYYAPDTGRWLNRDPAVEEGHILVAENTDDTIDEEKNLYAFVANNSINYIDPVGLQLVIDPVTTTTIAEKIIIGVLTIGAVALDEAEQAERKRIQEECEEERINEMRLQLQERRINTSAEVMFNTPQKGVTLSQVWDKLNLLYKKATGDTMVVDPSYSWFPKNKEEVNLRKAIIHISNDIKRFIGRGTSGATETVSEYQWKKRRYRVELENKKGINLKSVK